METKIQILKPFMPIVNKEPYRYFVYYGGRSSGKSHSVARALLLRGVKERLRILCTREVQNTIKDSVHKLLKDIIEQHNLFVYEVQKDTIINRNNGTEFIFKGLRHNTNEIKSTEGIDICWVEEAQSITKDSIDVLTPTVRKEGSQIIFTFNRLHELDPVYQEFVMNNTPATYVCKINYDQLKAEGLLPESVKLEIEKDKDNPETYAHKWLGEPISQTDKAVISRTKILNAMNRTVEDDGQIIIGVDVARMGNDRTVFWKRKGYRTIDFEVHEQLRTTEVCDTLEQFAHFVKGTELKIDDTGVGGGVTDEMMKRGYNVVPINFGGEPSDKDKYPNLISEAWFHLNNIVDEISLPMDNDLLMELSTRQWSQDTKGKRRIESKQEYKKRGYRSPDLADACIICYYSGNYIGEDDIYM